MYGGAGLTYAQTGQGLILRGLRQRHDCSRVPFNNAPGQSRWRSSRPSSGTGSCCRWHHGPVPSPLRISQIEEVQGQGFTMTPRGSVSSLLVTRKGTTSWWPSPNRVTRRFPRFGSGQGQVMGWFSMRLMYAEKRLAPQQGARITAGVQIVSARSDSTRTHLDPKSGRLLREHVLQKRGGYRIKQEDLSPRCPFKVSQLLWRAEHAGLIVGRWIRFDRLTSRDLMG
jgi:hypothetical protein